MSPAAAIPRVPTPDLSIHRITPLSLDPSPTLKVGEGRPLTTLLLKTQCPIETAFHTISLGQPSNALAPETTSMSSLVIAAWRARL
jgi:hypothetical protein